MITLVDLFIALIDSPGPRLLSQQPPADPLGQAELEHASLKSSQDGQPTEPQPTLRAEPPPPVTTTPVRTLSRKQLNELEQQQEQQPQQGSPPPRSSSPIHMPSRKHLASSDAAREATVPPGPQRYHQRQPARRSPPEPRSPDGKRSLPLLTRTLRRGPRGGGGRGRSSLGSSSIPSLAELLARAQKQMQRSVSSPQLQSKDPWQPQFSGSAAELGAGAAGRLPASQVKGRGSFRTRGVRGPRGGFTQWGCCWPGSVGDLGLGFRLGPYMVLDSL